jgi:fructose-specific phosphotransferase system IIC component
MADEQEEEAAQLEEISEESRQYEESEQENLAEQSVGVEAEDQEQAKRINITRNSMGEDRSSFIHGLSVGLGIGCIATFVIMWITVFFSPQLPSSITYEGMLSVFIYPLIYLLAVGLVALTAGIVREYYALKNKI